MHFFLLIFLLSGKSPGFEAQGAIYSNAPVMDNKVNDIQFQVQGHKAWINLPDLFSKEEQSSVKGILRLELDTSNNTLTATAVTPEPTTTVPHTQSKIIIYPSEPAWTYSPNASGMPVIDKNPILQRVNEQTLSIVKNSLRSTDDETTGIHYRTQCEATVPRMREETTKPPLAHTMIREDEQVCVVFVDDPFPEPFAVYGTEDCSGKLRAELRYSSGEVLTLSPSPTTAGGYKSVTLKHGPRQVPGGAGLPTMQQISQQSTTSVVSTGTQTSSSSDSPAATPLLTEAAKQKRPVDAAVTLSDRVTPDISSAAVSPGADAIPVKTETTTASGSGDYKKHWQEQLALGNVKEFIPPVKAAAPSTYLDKWKKMAETDSIPEFTPSRKQKLTTDYRGLIGRPYQSRATSKPKKTGQSEQKRETPKSYPFQIKNEDFPLLTLATTDLSTTPSTTLAKTAPKKSLSALFKEIQLKDTTSQTGSETPLGRNLSPPAHWPPHRSTEEVAITANVKSINKSSEPSEPASLATAAAEILPQKPMSFAEVLQHPPDAGTSTQPSRQEHARPPVVRMTLPSKKEVAALIKERSPQALEKAWLLHQSKYNDPGYLALYLKVLQYRGEPVQARIVAEQWKKQMSLTHFPNEIIPVYVGNLCLESKADEALRLIDLALKNLPPNAHYFYYQFIKCKSDCLLHESKNEDAIALINDAISAFYKSGLDSPGILEMLQYAHRKHGQHLLKTMTKDHPLYRNCEDYRDPTVSAFQATDSLPEVEALDEIRNLMCCLDVKKIRTAYNKAEEFLHSHQFKTPLEKQLYYFQLVPFKAYILGLEENIGDAINLVNKDAPRLIQFLQILKKLNPMLLTPAIRCAEKLITAHCNRLLFHEPDGSQKAMEHLKSFLQVKSCCAPNVSLTPQRYTRLLPLYLNQQKPEEFREVIAQLDQECLEVKVAKIKLNLYIQVCSGCIFGSIFTEVSRLLDKYPYSLKVRLLEGELALNRVMVAYGIAEQGEISSRQDKNQSPQEILEEAIKIMDELILSTDGHHCAYTWRGHLASVQGQNDISRAYHQKAKEGKPAKLARLSIHIDDWYARKFRAIGLYRSEKRL